MSASTSMKLPKASTLLIFCWKTPLVELTCWRGAMLDDDNVIGETAEWLNILSLITIGEVMLSWWSMKSSDASIVNGTWWDRDLNIRNFQWFWGYEKNYDAILASLWSFWSTQIAIFSFNFRFQFTDEGFSTIKLSYWERDKMEGVEKHPQATLFKLASHWIYFIQKYARMRAAYKLRNAMNFSSSSFCSCCACLKAFLEELYCEGWKLSTSLFWHRNYYASTHTKK